MTLQHWPIVATLGNAVGHCVGQHPVSFKTPDCCFGEKLCFLQADHCQGHSETNVGYVEESKSEVRWF